MSVDAKERKEWVEKRYETADPWRYQINKDDADRKRKVIAVCEFMAPVCGKFDMALDVACGEGWLTEGLPAFAKCGLELSDAAAARFPTSVTRVKSDDMKPGAFDLVISTEALYEHYDWKGIMADMLKALRPGGVIVTACITKWEVRAMELALGKPTLSVEFPYRNLTIAVRAWRTNPSA